MKEEEGEGRRGKERLARASPSPAQSFLGDIFFFMLVEPFLRLAESCRCCFLTKSGPNFPADFFEELRSCCVRFFFFRFCMDLVRARLGGGAEGEA